jgi:hypothetical protein
MPRQLRVRFEKALWSDGKGDAEEHWQENRRNAVGSDRRQVRFDDLFFSRGNRDTRHSWNGRLLLVSGSGFHGHGIRALVQEKIPGREQSARCDDPCHARNCPRGDSRVND